MFDAYHKWLGIPPGQRPPTHYQLLGVAPDEQDPEVIESAAARQTAHVRNYQTGPQAAECVRLLKEIALARATLLSPARRQAYDAGLRPVARAAGEAVEDNADPLGDLGFGGAVSTGVSKRARQAPPKKGWVKGLLFGGALHVLGGAALVWFLFLRPKEPADPKPPDPNAAQVAAGGGKERPNRVVRPDRNPRPAEDNPVPRVGPRPENVRPNGNDSQPDLPKPDEPPTPKPEPVHAAGLTRTPAPPPVQVDQARKAVREQYQRRLDQLKPGARMPLVKEMLRQAREAYEERAEKFACYLEARDLAAQEGGVAEALEAVEALGLWFDVDAWALRGDVQDALLAKDSPVVNQAVAENALILAAEAMDADELSAARRFVKQAEAAAGKAKSPALNMKLSARTRELADFETHQKQLEEARAKLRDEPKDAATSLALGKHLGFGKGDWDKSLPLLAQGSDPALKQLAEKDLARPEDASERLALGETWLELAKKEADKPRQRLLARAGYWFDLAATTATGATKALADKGAKEVDALLAGTGAKKPAPYACRLGRARERLFRAGGGTEASDVAVARGLHWLARHQSPAGSWSVDRDETTGTALALLAFLGDGHTHVRAGVYRDAVQKGLKFLRAAQTRNRNGYFGGAGQGHALATMAVCEAFGLTKDPELVLPAQNALQLIVRSQAPSGGWGDNAKAGANTLITGLQILALKSGETAGLEVKDKAKVWKDASRWFDACMKDDGAAYGFKSNGDGDTTTSAIGLLCRLHLGWDRHNPALQAGLRPLREVRPEFSRNLNFNFFTNQLFYHLGGEAWDAWNPRLRDHLIATQEKGESHRGSWEPDGQIRGSEGGRLLMTSLALLNLEVYYRQMPLVRRVSAGRLD